VCQPFTRCRTNRGWAAVCSERNRIGSSAAYRTAGSMCLVMRGTLEVPSQYPQSPRDCSAPTRPSSPFGRFRSTCAGSVPA
jgi:hypothetical protein